MNEYSETFLLFVSFATIPIALAFMYAKFYFHFYYLKRSKEFFRDYESLISYMIDPFSRFRKPLESLELLFPLILRDEELEQSDRELNRLGKMTLVMVWGFYLCLATSLLIITVTQ